MMISQNEKKLMNLRLILLLLLAVLATVYFQCAGTAEAATNNPGIIPPYTGGTAPSAPVPAAPQVPNALNEILSEFRSSFNAWLPKIGVLLWWTFLSLSTISWVLKMAQIALSDQLSLGAALHHTVTFLLFVFFFKWVFSNGASLAMLIPDSMGKLANAVTGYNFSPDGVFDSAAEMASKIFAAASQLSWVEKLFGYLCAAVISLFLFGIAAIFIMIYVENIIVILCGFVLLVCQGKMKMSW